MWISKKITGDRWKTKFRLTVVFYVGSVVVVVVMIPTSDNHRIMLTVL